VNDLSGLMGRFPHLAMAASVSVILSITLFGCNASSQSAQGPSAPSNPKEVMMFLNNGEDRIGTLVHLDSQSYQIKTKKGVETIDRSLYQGLVLNNEIEKKVAEVMTTDPMAFMAGGKFITEIRRKIKTAYKEPETTCQPTSHLLVHFDISNQQGTKRPLVLIPSGCPEIDDALVKTIEAYVPPTLPKDIPFDIFPVNYVHNTKLADDTGLENFRKPEDKASQAKTEDSGAQKKEENKKPSPKSDKFIPKGAP
jgi:hypothetical protein